MKWSILILTVPQRRVMCDRLLDVLRPQLLGHEQEIELLVESVNPKLRFPVGMSREILRLHAIGEYISHIDDDDMVSEDYVESILPMLDGVDYVAFRLAMVHDGVFSYIEERGLCFGGVHNDGMNVHYRDISHLCPVKRELALKVPMYGVPGETPISHCEDSRWADEMRAAKILRTEHRINKVLYHYFWRSEKRELVNV